MAKRTVFETLVVDLPDSWVDQSTYVFAAADQKLETELPVLSEVRGFRSNVVITRSPVSEAQSLEAFVQDSLAQLRVQFPSFVLVADDTRTVAGRPARACHFTFEAPQFGVGVAQLQVHLLVDDAFYTLTFSSLPATFEAASAEFLRILDGTTTG